MFWNRTNQPAGMALLLWMMVSAHSGAVSAETATGINDWDVVPVTGSTYGLLTEVVNADGRLIAVGAYGTIILSDDGRTWRAAQTDAVEVTLTSVFFIDGEAGWAVGHDATILHTTDGGQTWAVQHSKPELETPLLSLAMTSGDRGLAVGAYGLAIETRDRGATWTERPLMSGRIEDFHLNGVFRGLSKDLVFVVAESGFVYRSVDRGHTFLQIRTPVTESFWRGRTLKNGTILIVGENGRVLSSKDLGASWVEIETGIAQGVSAVAELNDGRVLIVGTGGYAAVSAGRDGEFQAIAVPQEDFTSVVEGPQGLIVLTGKSGLTILNSRSDAQNRIASN